MRTVLEPCPSTYCFAGHYSLIYFESSNYDRKQYLHSGNGKTVFKQLP